jgi:organic hydroperoxide reductase OsmC/OhrA
MQPFPHHYTVATSVAAAGDIELTTPHVEGLRTATPAEFGGPGDRWSPETLLTGAVVDCFALTFRGIARNSKLPWTSLRCEIAGTLDRIDGVTQFTGFELTCRLVVPDEGDRGLARRVLDKAEQNCLVANSLKGPVHLHAEVETTPTMALSGV